jgi:nucleotide-binding universal stress UspA family protein
MSASTWISHPKRQAASCGLKSRFCMMTASGHRGPTSRNPAGGHHRVAEKTGHCHGDGIMSHVFCPTDFSVASHAAFQHALSLNLALHGRLTLMHVAGGPGEDAGGFPGVRAQLERWGRLPAGSTDAAVARLGITAEKVLGREGDPVDVVLHFLERHPADLIVLATHQREGRARWLGRPVAEPIARGAQAMTLFLPHGSAGFVDARTGVPLLRRILIPVCAQPAPQPAVRATVSLLRACGIARHLPDPLPCRRDARYACDRTSGAKYRAHLHAGCPPGRSGRADPRRGTGNRRRSGRDEHRRPPQLS